MAISEAQVQELLKSTIDPTTDKDYVTGKAVRNLKVSGGDVSVDIVLGYPAKASWSRCALKSRRRSAACPAWAR